MNPEVLVCDHQSLVPVPSSWLVAMEKAGAAAAASILSDRACADGAPLAGLDCIEVALVDDAESDRVHREFMGIEGATDVITFEHGEIVIGVEVARRQAEEYGEPYLRELFRYLVHGLLHLAGHEDDKNEDRAAMEEIQEALVAGLWPGIEAAGD